MCAAPTVSVDLCHRRLLYESASLISIPRPGRLTSGTPKEKFELSGVSVPAIAAGGVAAPGSVLPTGAPTSFCAQYNELASESGSRDPKHCDCGSCGVGSTKRG